jgi:hypothetical protein
VTSPADLTSTVTDAGERWPRPYPRAVDEQPRGIDPDDLATTLRVLEELTELPAGHPDIHVVKQATGRMYRKIRKSRRADARRPQQEADAAVLASTATGSPMRIDDETRGIPLVSSAPRRLRRRAEHPSRLLHLPRRLHPRRRVLPLALPGLRRDVARQA